MPDHTSESDTVNPRAYPPGLFAGGLLVGGIVHALRPVRVPLPRRVRVGVGSVACVGGVLLAGSALRAMQHAHTSVSLHQPTTALVTDGPYRYSRNPIYVGMALLYTGLALLGNALYPLVLLPLLLTALYQQVIRYEEHYLRHRFGQAYADYCARVRRWL